MASLSFCLLGDFQARLASGRLLTIRGKKAQALLAYLAVSPGSTLTRTKLAGIVWSDHNDRHARNNLRQVLTALRCDLARVKPFPLVVSNDRLALDRSIVDIDVLSFERLARSNHPDNLREADSLYRSDFLDGLYVSDPVFDEWSVFERERLRKLAIDVLERLAVYQVGADALRSAHKLLALDPLREASHRIAMQVYASQGETDLALRQYENCRDLLRRDLGVEPDVKTKAIWRKIREGRSTLQDTTPTPASKSIASTRDSSDPLHKPAVAVRTLYTKSDNVSVAYQVHGGGPIDAVVAAGWLSNLEYAWESPDMARFLSRLGSFLRIIRFDKRGMGMSDRDVEPSTIEERVDDIRAVMDAAGSAKTVLFGISEGGNMSIMFAATHPERTAALVLYGCFARQSWAPDYPWGDKPEVLEADIARLENNWGSPVNLESGAPSVAADEARRAWFGAYLRYSASLSTAKAVARFNYTLDVRHLLPTIQVPTLVLHRRGDRWVPLAHSRYLAENIPGAKLVELPGEDHIPFWGDQERLIEEIREFLEPRRMRAVTRKNHLKARSSLPPHI